MPKSGFPEIWAHQVFVLLNNACFIYFNLEKLNTDQILTNTMKFHLTNLLLFTLLTLNLSKAQTANITDMKGFFDVAAAAYHKPVCSEEVHALEQFLGLKPGAFTEELEVKYSYRPAMCEEKGYAVEVYYEANNFYISVENLGECSYYIEDIVLKENWYSADPNNLIYKTIQQMNNVPALFAWPDKNTTNKYDKIEMSTSKGEAYELKLSYGKVSEQTWENAKPLLELEKAPKKTSILKKISIRTDVNYPKTDMVPCLQHKIVEANWNTLTEDKYVVLKESFDNYNKEEIKELNLPTDFETWVKLTEEWKKQEKYLYVFYSESAREQGYTTGEYDISIDAISGNVKKNYAYEYNKGGNYFYGFPMGYGQVQSFDGKWKLKGYFFLGMPHGIMQLFTSKTDSTYYMFNFGRAYTKEVEVEKNGLTLKYISPPDGEPFTTGLVTEIHPDGKEVKAQYVNDIRHKVLSVKYKDGSYFDGHINANLQPEGFGTWHFDPAKHKGFEKIKGNFRNGKPIAGEKYQVGFSIYHMECPLDNQLYPHSPEGYTNRVWILKNEQVDRDYINYNHGTPTTAKFYKVSSADVSGYPTGVRPEGYEGEIDSALIPHGKGRLEFYEEGGFSNSWTGTFEHGRMTVGNWTTEPLVRKKKQDERKEEVLSNVVYKFFEICNFPSGNLQYKAHTDYDRGLGSEELITIENRGNDIHLLIMDKSNKANSATIETISVELTPEGKRLKWQITDPIQNVPLVYSNVDKSGNDAGHKSKISEYSKETMKYVESITFRIKADNSSSNLFIYVVH